MEMRYYQREAVDAILAHSESGGIVCAPTGSGKSVILNSAARELQRKRGGIALILTHSKILMRQNALQLERFYPAADEPSPAPIRQIIHNSAFPDTASLRRFVRSAQELPNGAILFSTPQTFAKLSALWKDNNIPISLIVDECHYGIVGAHTNYRRIFDNCGSGNNLSIFGLSATPYSVNKMSNVERNILLSDLTAAAYQVIEILGEGKNGISRADNNIAGDTNSGDSGNSGDSIGEDVDIFQSPIQSAHLAIMAARENDGEDARLLREEIEIFQHLYNRYKSQYNTLLISDIYPKYNKIIYEYTFDQALADGYVVPLNIKQDLITSYVRSLAQQETKKSNLDKSGELKESVQQISFIENLRDIKKAVLKIAADKDNLPMILFTPNIETVNVMTAALNEDEQFKAIGVHSRMDGDSDEEIANIRAGNYDIIVNTAMLTTGFDYPELKSIVLLRSINSRSLFIQIAGRGTRPFPGKDKCNLIDCSGVLNKFISRAQEQEEKELRGMGRADYAVKYGERAIKDLFILPSPFFNKYKNIEEPQLECQCGEFYTPSQIMTLPEKICSKCGSELHIMWEGNVYREYTPYFMLGGANIPDYSAASAAAKQLDAPEFDAAAHRLSESYTAGVAVDRRIFMARGDSARIAAAVANAPEWWTRRGNAQASLNEAIRSNGGRSKMFLECRGIIPATGERLPVMDCGNCGREIAPRVYSGGKHCPHCNVKWYYYIQSDKKGVESEQIIASEFLTDKILDNHRKRDYMRAQMINDFQRESLDKFKDKMRELNEYLFFDKAPIFKRYISAKGRRMIIFEVNKSFWIKNGNRRDSIYPIYIYLPLAQAAHLIGANIQFFDFGGKWDELRGRLLSVAEFGLSAAADEKLDDILKKVNSAYSDRGFIPAGAVIIKDNKSSFFSLKRLYSLKDECYIGDALISESNESEK